MQCTNCGFQNMPGSEVCGRCATSLRLATAVIDVHPPRASARTKRARRLLPVRKAYFRTRDALHTDEIAARVRVAAGGLLPVVARMLVPGWPHVYIGRPWTGALFFLAFLACLVPALLLFGTTWGSIWLGLAFSVHSSAALDVVNRTLAETDRRGRIVRSIVISILIGVLLYLPAIWLEGGLADPHTVQSVLGDFKEDDIIRVNRWKTPARGDVVLYDTGEDFHYVRRIVGHERVETIYSGENIDRVLAVPGDLVECRAGQLFVNGRPSPWLPLYPRQLADNLSFSVPPDQYLILPSGVGRTIDLQDPAVWQTISCVPRANITGRAWLQSFPWSRFHWIR